MFFFSWIAQRISLLMGGSEKCNRSEKKRGVCERERERDGQFKCIKFNLSYSFPLITPPLWTGIWFSQVLLNWLLRFEWESNNMRTHTPKPFLHIFFLCRYEQRYLSPSCSHLSWWPWGHCPCLWSPTTAKEPLCNQHSSRQTIVVSVCVCVCVHSCWVDYEPCREF